MRYRGWRIKPPLGNASSTITVLRLTSKSPQKTCRILNNPATARTRSVKVGHPHGDSKGPCCSSRPHNLDGLTDDVPSQPNQSAGSGGEQLWTDLNARVGNRSAQPIDPRLVVQAVGPIRGVVPTQPGSNQPQQTMQGKEARIVHPAAPLMSSRRRRTIEAAYRGGNTTHGNAGSQLRGIQIATTGHECDAAPAARSQSPRTAAS
jgi:hypothetical protein